MKALLIYAHLLVIFLVSAELLGEDNHIAIKAFGAINLIWVIIFAYMYAMWSLWQTFSN